jgi:hypothetical protein
VNKNTCEHAQELAMLNHDRGKVTIALICVVTTLWLAAPAAHGMGWESWGNDPLRAAQFSNWPEVLPVVNHRSRVYHVVGGEVNYYRLYYRGDTDALNAALRAFGQVRGEKLIVIRPGPAEMLSFARKKVPHDWSFHGFGPTQRKFSMDDRDIDLIPWPTLVIRPGVNVELEKVEIPPGATVLHTANLLEHYRRGLKENAKHARVRAAMRVSEIDPYAEQDARAMADMLDPEEKDSQFIWITADAVSRYGVRARFALPALRGLVNHEHKYVRERVAAAIEAIEAAEEDADAAEMHREMVQRIEKFVQGLKDAAPCSPVTP